MPAHATPTADAEAKPPLCVDLDGTLVRGDLMWEALASLAMRRPLAAIAAGFALRRGRAAFKAALAARSPVDPMRLPYHEGVLGWLRERRGEGRRVLLATAADRRHAEAVAGHLGLFDEVLASDGVRNLGSIRKRDLLCGRFGVGGFDYVGDHARKDLPVLRAARACGLVGAAIRLRGRLEADGRSVLETFPVRNSFAGTLLRALRWHQWAKNLLLFVPIATAHLVGDAAAWGAAGVAFACFCLLASATYLLNDLRDLRSDRAHPSKRLRPIASGELSIPAASGLAAALLAGAAALAALLPPGFAWCLLGYLAVTLSYTLLLKRLVLVDVVALAALYTVRIVAGAMAIEVPLSAWLLIFSLFVFTSLAFLKRHVELRRHSPPAGGPIAGRGYVAADEAVVRTAGISCGSISALVLALYVQSPQVEELYRTPEALWLLVPFMVYWNARVWLRAGRDEIDDDPVISVMADPANLALVPIAAAIVLAAAL